MLGAFGPTAGPPLPLWFQANFAKQQQKPDEDRIYAAFGRFIASYALAEAAFHVAARFFSGMPDNKARIVFSGMRLGDVIDRLRAFVHGMLLASDVEEAIIQFNKLGDVRDQFVHRLIEYDHGRGLTVTNRLTSRSTQSGEPEIFGLTDLEDMEFDCRVIFGRLLNLCNVPDYHGVPFDITLLGLIGPWRYKPLPPSKAAPQTASRRSKIT